jgi:hypothetical protein
MMCPVNDKHASCEICMLIRFLHAKNVSAVEIHRELYAVYGQSVMSGGTVRQWFRMFKGGQTNAHDEDRSGLPAVNSE